MTQDQAIILCFKIAEISGLVAIAVFIAFYSRWSAWWANAIGRTIVVKDLLLVVAFIPSVLSLFLNFNRLTSHIAAWVDIAMIGLISPVMLWRTVVFWRIHKAGGGKPEGVKVPAWLAGRRQDRKEPEPEGVTDGAA